MQVSDITGAGCPNITLAVVITELIHKEKAFNELKIQYIYGFDQIYTFNDGLRLANVWDGMLQFCTPDTKTYVG